MSQPRIFSRHSLVQWIELVVLLCFVTGSLVLVNYIVSHHDRRFDLTPEKRHTLSPQTLSVMSTFTEPVHAIVFTRPQERREFEDLMRLFGRASQHFSFSFIDLEKNPAKAESLHIKSYGAGVVEYRGKRERVQYFTEEGLMNALLRLTEKKEKVVRFVTGHGEKDVAGTDQKTSYSLVKRALEAENFRVENILLMQQTAVPDDTLLLVIGGPQKDFFQQELDMIDTYLHRGGRVVMMCDPVPLERVARYLETLGIGLTHDFIIDTKSKLMALDELTPIIVPDKRHPIAQNLNDVVVFPYARSVVPLGGSRPGIDLSVLAVSGQESWAERDTASVYAGKVRFDQDADLRGPVAVAVIARITTQDRAGLMVVLGDSDFISNNYIDILGNRDMFLNTVNWLADKQEMLFSRSKATNAPISILFLTENENRMLLWSAVIVEPALILLIGIAVILWRRAKR